MTTRSLHTLALTSVLATSVWAQDLPKPISLTISGKVLPMALLELSKASGLELKARPGFENVPLILSVHDKPVQAVMDKIAGACLGKWVKTDKGFVLEQDKVGWKKLEEVAFEARRRAIEENIKKYIDAHKQDEKWQPKHVQDLIEQERKERKKLFEEIIKNNPDAGSANVQIQKGSSKNVTPATSSLLEVLRRMPSDTLAKVGPGQRLVFSTSPTKMQSSLPFPATEVVNRFVDAHNLLSQLSQGGAGVPANFSVKGGLDLNAKPIAGQLAKMLVVLSRTIGDPGLSVEVKFADGTGEIVGSAQKSIQPSVVPIDYKFDSTFSPDPQLIFSPRAKTFATAFTEGQSSEAGHSNVMVIASSDATFRFGPDSPMPAPKLSSQDLAFLADPVNIDPQSTFVAEGLLQVAEAMKTDLVATLPDTSVQRLARESLKSPRASQFLKAVVDSGVTANDEEGWLVLSPQNRLKQAINQMDRSASRKLYSIALSKGYARLRDLAVFAQSLGSAPSEQNFGIAVLKLIDPYVASTLLQHLNESANLLQFLGTLDASTFEGLSPEITMNVLNMTSNQKRYFEQLTFGASGLGGTIIGEGDFTAISISDGPGQGSGDKAPNIGNDPTEAMPNGLPVQGRVYLKFEPKQLVQAKVGTERGGSFFTAGAFGGHLAFSSNSQPELVGKLPTYDRFFEAQGFRITVTREFYKGQSAQSNFIDAWIKPGAVAVAFESLSASFRSEVAKAKEQMSQSSFRFGDGDRPPPR